MQLRAAKEETLMRYWGRKPLKLIDGIMKNISSSTIIDPFGGAGTIVLSALKHGNQGIYLDINPYAWLVAFVNIIRIDAEEFRRRSEEVLKNLHEVDKTELTNDYLYYPNGRPFLKKENVERVSQLFSPANFKKLYSILRAIDNVEAAAEIKLALYGTFCSSLFKASKMNRENAGSWGIPSYWIPERYKEIDAIDAFRSEVQRFLSYFKKNKGYYLHQDVELYLDNALTFDYDNNYVLFTDPPYYDEIQYSELSFFYWAWLRESRFTEIAKEILGKDVDFKISDEMTVNPNKGISNPLYLKLFKQFLMKTRDIKRKYLIFHNDDFMRLQRVIFLVKEVWGRVTIKEIEITNHRTIGARGSNKYILIFSE